MKHLLPTEAWAWLQGHADDPPEAAPLFVHARLHRSTVNGWRFDGLPWERM